MSERNKKLDSVAKVLQGLFENSKSPLSEGFQRYRLEQDWEQVLGGVVGQQTRPVDFQKGMLVIAVKNPTLLTELRFFQQEIITKVNTHVGKVWVRKVRFVSE